MQTRTLKVIAFSVPFLLACTMLVAQESTGGDGAEFNPRKSAGEGSQTIAPSADSTSETAGEASSSEHSETAPFTYVYVKPGQENDQSGVDQSSNSSSDSETTSNDNSTSSNDSNDTDSTDSDRKKDMTHRDTTTSNDTSSSDTSDDAFDDAKDNADQGSSSSKKTDHH